MSKEYVGDRAPSWSGQFVAFNNYQDKDKDT